MAAWNWYTLILWVAGGGINVFEAGRDYDPYGQTLTTPANNLTGNLDYGWVGQHQKLTQTQTPHPYLEMGVRVYLPTLGRFLQPDPILGGSDNDYEYASGDPTNRYDLDGHWSWTDLGRLVIDVSIGLAAAAVVGVCIASVACGIALGATALAGVAAAGTVAHRAYGAVIGTQRSLATDVGAATWSTLTGPVCRGTCNVRFLLRNGRKVFTLIRWGAKSVFLTHNRVFFGGSYY